MHWLLLAIKTMEICREQAGLWSSCILECNQTSVLTSVASHSVADPSRCCVHNCMHPMSVCDWERLDIIYSVKVNGASAGLKRDLWMAPYLNSHLSPDEACRHLWQLPVRRRERKRMRMKRIKEGETDKIRNVMRTNFVSERFSTRYSGWH